VGWAAALLLAGAGATVGAQQSQAPTSGARADDQATITVTGCVQKETTVLKRSPVPGEMGMTDEFVLTHAMLNPATKATDMPNPETPPASPPVGTAGSPSNLGKVYRVTGDKESELKAQVGQRVEITGTFKKDEDAKAELGATGTSGRAVSGELTKANTPEITISSIKPVAGSCSGGGAH